MTDADLPAARRALLERLFAAFNRHDADGVMACFIPEVVFDTAAGPEPHGCRLTGQDAVRAAFVSVWTDMPDVAWTVTRHTLAGERATSEWLFTGTRADGGRVAVEGVDLFVFEGRLIARKSAFRKDR
ncbi:nuclear transport factor 2 family protein, partial [Methylobacterium sp. WL64]|uniref:nuclear transport factor 2 family protein n=1 Tax=Methylobacterium sp. WL64 TaxID=2603894 RepID=UPI0011C9C376